MSLDPITEIVSHFIGIFHIATEEARLRDFYEQFARRDPAEADIDPAPLAIIPFQSPYDLGRFDPGVVYTIPPAPTFDGEGAALGGGVRFDLPIPGPLLPDLGPAYIGPAGPGVDILILPGRILDGAIQLPLPGSFATYTVQILTLEDDDLLVFGDAADFVLPEVYYAQLVSLAEIGASLHAVDRLETIAGLAGSSEEIVEAAMALTSLDLPQQDFATASSHRVEGQDAIIVNGVVATEMPTFEDYLPAFLKPEAEEEPAPDAPPVDPHAAEEENPFAVDPGHAVVTGANMSLNEAFVSVRWVDAPVISVAGDVIAVDSISQVNVLFDVDQGISTGGPTASQAINAAQISVDASPSLDAGAAGMFGLPTDWAVERIETDLVLVNWVDQHIFATDTDRVEVSFTGSNTFLGTGENLLSNLTSIAEYGLQYDLIIVGGNMVTVNAITQTLVLLDNDVVEDGDALPSGVLSSNDNLLLNQALISKTGVDTVGAMTDAFQAATEDLVGGATSLSSDVAQSALFAGKGLLKALFVKGDFIKMNLIEQTNVVGDVDQVKVALDALQASISGQVQMTLGSNALLNTASIDDRGVDSLVMAQGEVYSDALIYQADLIDIGVPDIGGGVSALASEAVAFLADGLLTPAAADDEQGPPPFADFGSSLDVLHSMLS